MYRITIVGRDLEEFQKNLRDYAAVHSGNSRVPKKLKTSEIAKVLVEENDDEEMEEVVSPFSSAKVSEVEVEEVESLDEEVNTDVELDAEGFPWDKRIHASSKEKKANGTWRARRNLDEAVLKEVTAELIAKGFGKVTSVLPTQEQVQQAVTVDTVVAEPVVTQAALVMPVIPSLNVNSGHTFETFKSNFPMVLASLINDKKIDQNWVNQVAAHYGVKEIWTINDTQKAELFDTFVQSGLITKVG